MILDSENFGSLDSGSLLAKAREVAGSTSSLVITFCDSAYRDVLMNWLQPLRHYGRVPLLVIALDADLASQLERGGVPVIRARCDEGVHGIWAIRAQVLHAMVAGGLNVIHSDVDAVWIKNPMGLLEKIDADIVASQGTVHPPECHAAWGHVLCYGFMLFRASAATVELLGEAAEVASREERFDDQRLLNHQLLARGIKWAVRSPYRLPFRDTLLTCSREPIFGECSVRSGSIRVAIIPHANIQRLPNSIEDPRSIYVSHPLSPKDASKKFGVLSDNGAWFIAGPNEGAKDLGTQ